MAGLVLLFNCMYLKTSKRLNQLEPCSQRGFILFCGFQKSKIITRSMVVHSEGVGAEHP